MWKTQGAVFSGNYANVAGSRVWGTTYTNSLGRPIFVSVSGYITSNVSQGFLYAYVNGFLVQTASVSDANWGSGWLASTNSVSFVVPPGGTYQMVRSLSNIALSTWVELN